MPSCGCNGLGLLVQAKAQLAGLSWPGGCSEPALFARRRWLRHRLALLAGQNESFFIQQRLPLLLTFSSNSRSWINGSL